MSQNEKNGNKKEEENTLKCDAMRCVCVCGVSFAYLYNFLV